MAFEKAEKEREMMGEQEEAVVTEISDEQRLKLTEMRMLRSATILERMLNLNTFHEVAEDFPQQSCLSPTVIIYKFKSQILQSQVSD